MHRARIIGTAVAAIAVAAAMTTATHAYSVAGYKWDSAPVPFYVNPANQDVSANAAIAAIQSGMHTWNTAGGWFRFSYAGQVSDTTTTYDRRNVIVFRNEAKPDGSAALATTYSWSSNGVRVDSDIVFWDGKYQFYTGSSGCSGVNAYIEDVATHELGHALGLLHSSSTDATMYATYRACSTTMRTLAADDLAGLTSLYSASGATTNTAPTVTITAPASNSSVSEGTSLTFSGSAGDTEDGNLSAKLQWKSSIDGALGTGSSLSKLLSAGTHTITAVVVDNGGLSATKQITVMVTARAAVNTAPSVTITAPVNNASVPEGASVSFSGSASDSEDGNISARLQWKSSIAGAIGTGSSFSKVLTAGTHTITATVTDIGGLSASKQVVITIAAGTASPATPRTLVVKTYKVKGNQKADLTWNGFTSANVDIHRSGSKVATAPNNRAWTDSINQKGSGSYTYKICETGTSTCSSQVTAAF